MLVPIVVVCITFAARKNSEVHEIKDVPESSDSGTSTLWPPPGKVLRAAVVLTLEWTDALELPPTWHQSETHISPFSNDVY